METPAYVRTARYAPAWMYLNEMHAGKVRFQAGWVAHLVDVGGTFQRGDRDVSDVRNAEVGVQENVEHKLLCSCNITTNSPCQWSLGGSTRVSPCQWSLGGSTRVSPCQWSLGGSTRVSLRWWSLGGSTRVSLRWWSLGGSTRVSPC